MATDWVLLPERVDDRSVPGGRYRLSGRVGGEQEITCFLLDRFPVTVERYGRFIDAGGYQERSFWDAGAWAWKETQRIRLPRFWDDPKWRRFVRARRPVVGVSWYEARAFCAFEGRRLPSEREWEAAARGFEGSVFPWGDEWIDGLVGVRGVGPRMTWPVGTFRGGRGPFGHEDIIGNVWQWTVDPLGPDEPESMAVRGGSWASPPEQNRTDHWNGYDKGARFSHLGFRTARIDGS